MYKDFSVSPHILDLWRGFFYNQILFRRLISPFWQKMRASNPATERLLGNEEFRGLQENVSQNIIILFLVIGIQ